MATPLTREQILSLLRTGAYTPTPVPDPETTLYDIKVELENLATEVSVASINNDVLGISSAVQDGYQISVETAADISSIAESVTMIYSGISEISSNVYDGYQVASPSLSSPTNDIVEAPTVTPDALPNMPATRGVLVVADLANTASVFVGGPSVTTANGTELTAGDAREYPVANANLIYCIAIEASQFLRVEVV